MVKEQKISPRREKELLGKLAEGIQKGTKTTMATFEPLHLFLRDRIPWYRNWHSSRITNILHWVLLLASLALLFYISSQTHKTVKESRELPTDEWVIFEKKDWEENSGISNVRINEHSITIEDASKEIGTIRKKKTDLKTVANWKSVSWNADVPEGTSITFKVRGSDVDSPEAWEKTEWTGYYSINSDSSSGLAASQARYKYLEIEIVLQAMCGKSPTLNTARVGYTPHRETAFSRFVQRWMINPIVRLFERWAGSQKSVFE